MATDRRKDGDTILRKTQLVQLYLLDVLDEICKKHGIPYFLVDGTLLGAFRHNGFIPWDDDIDVGMLKPDYQRFKRIVCNELPAGVYFESEKDMHNTCPCGKLRDLKSFFFNGTGSAERCDRKYYGMPIDIFPFVRMPRLPYKYVYLLLRFRMGPYGRWHRLMNRQRRSVCMRMADALAAAFWKCIHGVAILTWNVLADILPSKMWHEQPEGGFVSRCSESDLFPLGEHRFEQRNYPVPRNGETYLSTLFGDWHQIPPPEKRPVHSQIVFPEL